MFGIVVHRQINAEIGRQRIDEAVDRTGTLALDPLHFALVHDLGSNDAHALEVAGRIGVVINEFQTRIGLRHVALHEALINALGGQFHALLVGDALNVLAKLHLQIARQVQAVILLQDIGDATLAGLRVDADDRLVGSADILRIDRQIGHFPDGVIGDLDRLHALVDRILMRAGKGSIDQFADIRVTLGDRHFVGIFVDGLDALDIGAIQFRVHALSIHVQRQRHHVHIARALAIAKQRAFDTVGTRHQAEFGGGNARAAVIVRMQRDDDIFAVVDIAAHPFDLVGIDVGRRHFHGGGQIQDQLVIGGRLHHVDDGVADVQCHFQLRAGKAFRRIFEAITAASLCRHVGDHLRRIDGNLLDAVDVLAEDHAALQFAGGVVEMDDGVLGTFQRLEGAGDQFRAALHQHLQRYVIRHISLFHAPAGKVEIRLRGGWKTDFDFLETHVQQQLEHARLAIMTHRIDQRLIAVTQVHRTPDRGLVDGLAGPCAVGNVDDRIRAIFHACFRHALGNAVCLRVHRLAP